MNDSRKNDKDISNFVLAAGSRSPKQLFSIEKRLRGLYNGHL